MSITVEKQAVEAQPADLELEEKKSEPELDIVLYGATGFTGQWIAKQLCRKYLSNHSNLKLGIAGRSLNKLNSVFSDLLELAQTTEEKHKINDIKIVVANADNESELRAMIQATKLIINATGPFRFFGENVIRIAAESGTNYVDICGEPEFIEKCALKYHEIAVKSGAVIVSACGFDSVPSDIGHDIVSTWFRNNGALCSTIDCFINGTAPKGYSTHATTFRAAVHGFTNVEELVDIRKQLRSVEWRHNRRQIKRVGPKLHIHKEAYFWSDDVSKYSILFPGADSSVVSNSQGFRSALLAAQQPNQSHTFPQFGCYFSFNSFGQVCKASFVGATFKLFVGSQCGRNLLLKHPSFFTMGGFSDEGPTREQMDSIWFESHFYGCGYSQQKITELQSNDSKTDNNDHDLSTLTATAKPDIKMHCTVGYPDPGYLGTATFVTECALCLFEEIDTIKKGDLSKGIPAIVGGIFTPSVVFSGTTLVERLTSNGIRVSIDVLEGKNLVSEDKQETNNLDTINTSNIDQNA